MDGIEVKMIEEIKVALPILTVIQDAGIIINQGRGLCPFHEDQHPCHLDVQRTVVPVFLDST